MKILGFIFKNIVWFVALIYGFDKYVIERANTVVEPTKVKVKMMYESHKVDQERVERELLMIRSQNDEMKNMLIEMGN